MGIYVLALNPRSRVNRTFFIVAIWLVLINFICIFIQLLPDPRDIIQLFRIGTSLSGIFYSLIILFAIYISGILKIEKRYIPLLFIIPAYLTYRNLTIPSFVEIFRYDGLWRLLKIGDQFNFYLVTTYWILSTAVFVAIILRWECKTKSTREKKQAFILIFSFFITTAMHIVYNIFIINIFKLIRHDILGINMHFNLIWMAGIFYCIVRYRFLAITPEYVTREILSNIEESIILMDAKKQIITVNRKTLELMSKQKMNEGSHLPSMISGFDSIDHQIDLLLQGSGDGFSSPLHYINGDEKIFMDFKFSLVRDKFNDILGVLIIGRELKELRHFQIHYKITDKEIEIIQSIINGHTNMVMGERLGITENTVKRHITNIYNKLGINNKIGLLNLLKEFNVKASEKESRLLER